MSIVFEDHNDKASDLKICVTVFPKENLSKEVEVNIHIEADQSSTGPPAINITPREEEDPIGKPYQCDACGKWYKTAHSLAQHKHVKHTGAGGKDRCKTCKECNTVYKLNSYYSHRCVKNAKNRTV